MFTCPRRGKAIVLDEDDAQSVPESDNDEKEDTECLIFRYLSCLIFCYEQNIRHEILTKY